jgi:uncharacterized metal-binding protein
VNSPPQRVNSLPQRVDSLPQRVDSLPQRVSATTVCAPCDGCSGGARLTNEFAIALA